MLRYLLQLLPVVATLFYLSAGDRLREVHIYDECPKEYQFPLGVGSGRIKDDAFWASSSNKKRPPHNARLGDPTGAWTADIQNALQVVGVDLGADYFVTAIATQGRQGSEEFVTEYFMEYSDDKETWQIYTNEFGIPEMFNGNDNSYKVVQNTLMYPVVARYIRFNPQRWSMFISMRIEIYGCLFKSYVASFDGNSRMEYDLSQQSVPLENNLLELRFKTNKPDGILFYASGNQGDFMLLEMRRGYMYFKIDLGSTQTSRGRTEVKAGSLLDDHQWHDVVIKRWKKNLVVVVDRLLNKVETNGLFYRLDLDKFLYLGGLPYFRQDGVEVKYNFTGCIENVNFDGARLVQDAQAGTSSAIRRVGVVAFNCGIASAVPVTFASSESYLKVDAPAGGPVRVSFEFRTHDEDGLLVYHPLSAENSGVTVRINSLGYIAYKVVSLTQQTIEDVVRNTDVLSETKQFTDGLWHSFSIYVDKTKVNCTVDRNVKVSERSLKIEANTLFYIGGMDLELGFRGCIRNLEVAARIVDLEKIDGKQVKINNANIGSCSIRDRCTPNPCEHGGNCTQDWNKFYCNCQNSGYHGAMCHISQHHISCTMMKLYSAQNEKDRRGLEDAIIDPDGSGPLKPFKVKCEIDDQGKTITHVGHNSEESITVDGYQEPGSYVRFVEYAANLQELTLLIERAESCRQYIEYMCYNAKLLAKPGTDLQQTKTYGWWVGRTYQPMYYWGGAAPGSFKCTCGLDEKGCIGASDTCNCDAGLPQPTSDKGYLVHKDFLPVLELHFGDTGTVTDTKVASHKLGILECTGDDLFDNVITFRKVDATLQFATFEAKNAGDIWFQFRTTATDGVMIHNTGIQDFIEIRLFQTDKIQFRFNVGNGIQVVTFNSPTPLNEDTWHTVHVEHNRKEAWMKVDDFPAVYRAGDADLVRMLDLTSPLIVGAAVDFSDGYVGCMRGLRVNGQLLDMKGIVEREEVTYGVTLGCIGKCASSPCFNGGTCREKYSGYTCDCSYTPFRGWMCGREVGVNLQTNYMVLYTFDETQGLSASDFQHARIGFSTKRKQGILMQMRNKENTEYISVEMNSNGGVRVALDIGFERDEVNTPNIGIDFANGQQHEVKVTRLNKGKTLIVQVDDYPPGNKTFDVSDTSDTILDNPKYLFIGSNDTSNTGRGFEGCIFRMQVDNIFPLKRAFQDPPPTFISLIPKGKVREDMCGFEEITRAPDPIETRPRGGDVVNVTYPYNPNPGQLNTLERIILGVVLAVVFFLIILVIGVIVKNKACEGGDYETEEAKGAELADNPDTAVVYNQTGLPEIEKRQEWFM
ncbi:neurexin-4-like [Gigantopelta aegis]|uniref:neurexin-4-like n=1 Tax=Gigantopelta aegis TaxID=1735272 RepID=UPI001B88A073|nr:neurexin-4-like [Gigantopelta aegis]